VLPLLDEEDVVAPLDDEELSPPLDEPVWPDELLPEASLRRASGWVKLEPSRSESSSSPTSFVTGSPLLQAAMPVVTLVNRRAVSIEQRIIFIGENQAASVARTTHARLTERGKFREGQRLRLDALQHVRHGARGPRFAPAHTSPTLRT